MFQISDRVILTKDYPDGVPNLSKGDAGTVVSIVSFDDNIYVGIRFDKWCDGHDCGGKCEDGFGWNISINNIEFEAIEEFVPCSDSEFMAFIGVNT